MASKTAITKNKSVIVGYVCSSCKNPIIAVVTITAETYGTDTLFENTQKVLEREADRLVEKEINRIKDCVNRRESIVIPEEDARYFNHYREVGVDGIGDCCPNCRHKEAWQEEKPSAYRMNILKEEHFPVVFTKYEEAGEWAANILLSRATELNEKRQDDSRVRTAQEMVRDILFELEELKIEKSTMPELLELERLNKKENELCELKNKLGLFDFRRKKEMDEKIAAVRHEKSPFLPKVIEFNSRFERETFEKRLQLQRVQLLAYGTTGNIVKTQLFFRETYLLEPNPVPKEDRPRIERQKETTMPKKSESKEDQKGNIEPEKINEPKERVVFCRKCGFKLLPDSAFCTRCGAKIVKE